MTKLTLQDNDKMLAFSIKDAESIGYLYEEKMKQTPLHTQKSILNGL